MAKKEENKATRMLYKYPGKHEIYDDMYDYIIVPETDADLEKAKKDGWSLTPEKAKEAFLKNQKKSEK